MKPTTHDIRLQIKSITSKLLHKPSAVPQISRNWEYNETSLEVIDKKKSFPLFDPV